MTESDPELHSQPQVAEDTDLIQQAVSKAGTIYSEAEQMKLTGRLIQRVGELTRTIGEHGQATNDLTERVRRLNVWLLIVTIAIGAMTIVQAVAAFKSLMR